MNQKRFFLFPPPLPLIQKKKSPSHPFLQKDESRRSFFPRKPSTKPTGNVGFFLSRCEINNTAVLPSPSSTSSLPDRANLFFSLFCEGRPRLLPPYMLGFRKQLFPFSLPLNCPLFFSKPMAFAVIFFFSMELSPSLSQLMPAISPPFPPLRD